MPSIQENTFWDTVYNWSEDGDEWNDQAAYCNIAYKEWKQSIVEKFIHNHIHPNSTVLEIAPGHGRWTEHFLEHCHQIYLVDLNKTCIEFCKKKFAEYTNIQYINNDGTTLAGVPDNSVDFVFSYDSFVHMEQDVTTSYLHEIHRVLKPGGSCILHHPGRFQAALTLKLHHLRRLGKPGYLLYQLLSIGRYTTEGWRANVSKQMVAMLAKKAGLQVEYQIQEWGPAKEYTVKLFNDYITKLVKPESSSS